MYRFRSDYICIGLLFLCGCTEQTPGAGDSSTAAVSSQLNTDGASSGKAATQSDSPSVGKSSDKTPSIDETSKPASKSGSKNTGSKYTRSSDDKEPSLPTDRTPWKQKEFYLSTFRAVPLSKTEDVYEKSMRAHKEAGFNLVENAILSTDDMFRALDACEKIGLKCFAQDISTFSGMGDKYPLNNDEMMLDMILQLCNYRSLVGYYLWDEPVEGSFAKLRYVKDFFKDKDPGRLAYSLVFPSYGVYTWSFDHANWASSSYKKYVDNYLSTVDPEVIGVDYYPFQGQVSSISENYLWRDLGYLRKKGLELKKPLWFYFQAVGMSSPQVSLTNAQLRVQMFSALAYGTVGLSYYTSLGILVDEEGNKLPRFNELKTLNGEVLNLGRFLFGKTSSKLYHTGVSADKLAGYFVDGLEASDLILSAPDDVLMGVFTDKTAAQYLVVVNKNFKSALNGQLKLRGVKNVKRYNKATNKTTQLSASTDTLHLQIPAGDCEVFIIQ